MSKEPDFSLSESAVEKLSAVMAQRPRGTVFRVSVKGGGCAGFSYSFALEERGADDDFVLRYGEVSVVIDPLSAELMAGARLDYTNELIGAHFRVVNPLADATCGCGVSFALKDG